MNLKRFLSLSDKVQSIIRGHIGLEAQALADETRRAALTSARQGLERAGQRSPYDDVVSDFARLLVLCTMRGAGDVMDGPVLSTQTRVPLTSAGCPKSLGVSSQWCSTRSPTS